MEVLSSPLLLLHELAERFQRPEDRALLMEVRCGGLGSGDGGGPMLMEVGGRGSDGGTGCFRGRKSWEHAGAQRQRGMVHAECVHSRCSVHPASISDTSMCATGVATNPIPLQCAGQRRLPLCGGAAGSVRQARGRPGHGGGGRSAAAGVAAGVTAAAQAGQGGRVGIGWYVGGR